MMHKTRSYSIAVSLVLCLVALILGLSTAAQAEDTHIVQMPFVLKDYPLQLSGQVVFVSNRDVDPEIYLMDYDGSNLVQLTYNNVADSSPDWSPDGTHIVYSSNLIDDVREIYVMDADGENIVRLTTIGECNYPKWSPDGGRIAFTCHNLGDILYTMDPDGGNLLPITPTINDIQELTWSPDSEQIAFSTMFSSPAGIYVIDAEGGTPQPIFEREYVSGVAWSPDGRWLAMNSMTIPSYTHDLFLYDLENETLTRLTNTVTNHFSPNWFPGGQYLVFQGFLEDAMTSYIYTIAQNGTHLQQISDGGSDYGPDWKP